MSTINLISFPPIEETECPNCHQVITLFDAKGSEFCVCSSCNSFIQFSGSNKSIVYKRAPKIKETPILVLGAEGLINDYKFKVIGYLEKKESNTTYTWKEYILYNYQKGYATLAEFEGHWNFVAGKEFYPDLDKLTDRSWSFIEYDDFEYSLYNKYRAEVTALIGEFEWNVLEDKPLVVEYIAPPFMILKESGVIGKSKSDFYLGQYMSAKELAIAFNIDEAVFPAKNDIGANEPSKYFERWNSISRITPFLLLAIFIIQLFISFLKPERELLSQDFNINYDSVKAGNEYKPFNTPTFEIKDRSSSLEFKLSSAVDNNWLEATVVLLNETTNQSWEVNPGIEYYHGYEDGESWTEGSQATEVLLSEIPPGKYHLNIYPSSGDIFRTSLFIKVTSDTILWRNIWVTLLVLCLYPAYCWYMMRNFEKRRWMNSNFSPYDTE